MTQPMPPRPACQCGDSYCSDVMPPHQDRTDCCQYCGFYSCDVCGWTAPTAPAASRKESTR